MFVLSGVSSDKYEVAKDTIIEEFNKIQAGQFDDSKLALAKKVIVSQRQESQDKYIYRIEHCCLCNLDDIFSCNMLYSFNIHIFG